MSPDEPHSCPEEFLEPFMPLVFLPMKPCVTSHWGPLALSFGFESEGGMHRFLEILGRRLCRVLVVRPTGRRD
eukprot:1492055-Pyramimonas_sp.AAC.1